MKKYVYPSYKDTGIEWLGEVPVHWDIKQLKRTFLILNGSTPKSGEPDYWNGDIAWVTPDDLGSLTQNTINATRRRITQEGYKSCGTTIAPAGSLVLSTRAPIGHLAIAGIPMCSNQGCRCLVFRKEMDPRFYYYQLLTGRHELESWGQGSTFKELGRDKLAAVYLISPPSIDEQHAIAAFLDRETTRIDSLIEKKQRQIELLQEKRSALISHAVTKGLDPNVKMKDSGVEWLGEIPVHWEVHRLKYLFWNLDCRRIPLSSEVRADMAKTYPYYGASGIIDAVEDYIFDEPLILVAEDGANLLSRSTPLAFVATGKYWVNNHAHILKPFEGPLVYWESVLQTFDYTPLISGAAQPKLTAENLGTIPLPRPPLNEQQRIAAFLNAEMDNLDQMVEKIDASIDMLREYRTAMISAAVTGKIDVRDEASA